jgi:cholinesterase
MGQRQHRQLWRRSRADNHVWVRHDDQQIKLTVSRESAGGASTDFYSYAYPDDPIIAGAIAESGSVWSFANPQPKDNSKHWNEAAKALSCPTSPVSASVKCMRTKSMDEILKATVVANPLLAVLGNFGPTVDDKVVFGDYDQRAAAGKFIRKPFMAGNNAFEPGLFILIAKAAGIKVPTNIWATFNPAVFTCPVGKASDARAAQGLTTFRYVFFGDYPNTMLQPGSGAYHTAEIPMIFGTSEYASEDKNTAVEDRVSKFMQKTWTQFAKDPAALTKAPFSLPLLDIKNKYTKETIIGFGANNVTRQLLLPSSYDGYCEAIENIIKTIPGGIRGAIENVASGKDMGIPGLKASEVPDMSPPDPPPPPPGAV